MQYSRLRRLMRTNRGGYILLLLLLLGVVLGGFIWMALVGPSTLSRHSSDPNMPWNQEHRLLEHREQVPPPSEQQPNITELIEFTVIPFCEDSPDLHPLDDLSRGRLGMTIRPDGRIAGGWTAEYNPSAEINYLVMDARFEGNIDPSEVYSDENGQDRSKLYFITKGFLSILKTNLKSNKVRHVKGYIYVTGWLDHHNATGKITITPDKKTFQSFYWSTEPLN